MIESIFSGIGGIADSIHNTIMSNKQYELQKQNMEWQQGFNERQFAYQQDLNKQIMNREDTAVQRRAADLKNAGMSKWLAAGQGASSSVMGSSGSSNSSSPTMSPQLNLQNAINGAMSTIGTIANLKNTEAATADAMASADLKKVNALTEISYRRKNIMADTELKSQQKSNLLKEYDKLTHDLDLSRYQNLRTNDSMNSIYNSVNAFSERTVKGFQDLFKSIFGFK